MGIWFPAVPLAAGERVLYKRAANSFRGWRSIGGQVVLTDRRLVFVPHRLDALTGASRSRREILRSDIHGVQILDPGLEAVKQRGAAASIRPQLQITDKSDSPLVVTVLDLEGLYVLLSP